MNSTSKEISWIEKIIAFFADRHLLSNFIALGILIGGIVAWINASKEELPDVTFDRVRISATYPGASAEDVEYFVTEPIERQVRGLDGVYRVTSNSSSGRCTITAELEQNLDNRDEVITEIRNTVQSVNLPEEIIDDPQVRVFQTSKKAIIDIALIHKQHRVLTVDARRQLQGYVFALENQLLALSEVNSIDRNGYLKEEIHIKADPAKLRRYEIPFNTAMNEIRQNNVRKPAGILDTDREPKVTLSSELNTPEKIKSLVVQGGFEGSLVHVRDFADVASAYEKNISISKVNGYEAVLLNVVKNSNTGILEALKKVLQTVERFKENNLKGSSVEVVFLDDESIDLRNRIDIIYKNGVIGFVLIVVTLFIFLNKRSAFWVAFGIPLSLAATIVGIYFLGYTINGITLAAIIVVLGMVVDDAIVIAENITRLSHQGLSQRDAVIKGTSHVAMPVVAAILTTCAAFLPLLFFSGRYGVMIAFIPPVIFLMLFSSLFESLFILPGHMHLDLPGSKKRSVTNDISEHWFDKVEEKFGKFLKKLLPYRLLIIGFFIGLLVLSGWLFVAKMKFVMFPNEETRDISISGETPNGSTREETSRLIQPIEDFIASYIGKEVVGFRTEIAQSRRGSSAKENSFRIIIEIVTAEKRKKSADQLVDEFQAVIEKTPNIHKARIQKSHWGQSSGSPIEILVQLNNDAKRSAVMQDLSDVMKQDPALKNIELDEGLRTPEYRVSLKGEKIKRLSISPNDIASTFRAALDGSVLYKFSNGDEEVYSRFTVQDEVKKDINRVLDLPVENRGNYLVPLRNIVNVEKTVSPASIERQDMKRTSVIYAEIEKSKGKTPLEIAERYEQEVFPALLAKHPTAALSFAGEVQDTRESKSDFLHAILMVLLLIYFILAILFDSLIKPLVIMLSIPFGMVGIILAFYLHGKLLFGFYATVGALGLAGVIINDSIVLLAKLKDEFNPERRPHHLDQIADITKTRLRAVVLTTVTTVVGLLPTAYGVGGYDAMLSDMMLALSWGLTFGTCVTLVLIPCIFSLEEDFKAWLYRLREKKFGNA